MPSKVPQLLLTHGLWTAAAVLFVGSCLLAVHLSDAHWVCRGGAAIAALAAGAVGLQIAVEISIERQRHTLQGHDEAARGRVPEEATAFSALERLALRIHKIQVSERLSRLDSYRLQMALRVVLCAMFGELLHGFGDQLACLLLMTCVMHG